MAKNRGTSSKELQRAYDEWHSQEGILTDDWRARFIDSFGIGHGKKLLDVACGNGRFLETAEKKGLDVYGIDISKKAIEKVKSRIPDAKVIVGDAEKIPLRKECFDFVTCLGSLEHFIRTDEAIILRTRVISFNGLSLIIVPNSYFIGNFYIVYRYGRLPPHANQPIDQSRTIKEWQNLLEEGGLKIIKVCKHNHIDFTGRVRNVTRILYNIFSFLIPLNLSLRFIFVCKPEKKVCYL